MNTRGGRRKGGNGGLVAVSIQSTVFTVRVTYWTGSLSLCLSVSLKQLCSTGTLYSRDSSLSLCFPCLVFFSFFDLHLSWCHLFFLSGLWFILSLCWSPLSLRSEYCTLQPSPPLSHPPSQFPLPCFPVSLSLSHSLCVKRQNGINGQATVTVHATGCR